MANKTKKETKKLYIPDADKKLREICEKGLGERFGDCPPDAVKTRLSNELRIVSDNDHSAYYLLASMLAGEAKRLHHVVFFRGTITGSLIAYTSGISDINPMEKEYGGVDLPFEITREEFEGIEPTLDILCSVAFIFFAQAFLAKIIPEYRCLSFPLNSADGIRSIRVVLAKDDELPTTDPVDMEGSRLSEYPDFMFFDKYFHLALIGQESMEIARYNTFYKDGGEFDENDSEKLIPKLWKYVKDHDDSIQGYKRLKVRTYEELVTVLSMAHSTDVWKGLAKKMVLNGSLPLGEMIGTRDDLFKYMVKIGIERKEAYMIMNRVRKGKHLSEDEEKLLREHGTEEWVIELCANARYIFPRAHVVQLIRRDAYCLNEPENSLWSGASEHVVLQNSFIG